MAGRFALCSAAAAALVAAGAVCLGATAHASLPLGDGDTSSRAAEPRGFWKCKGADLGAAPGGARPWIRPKKGRWDPGAKPAVPGSVRHAQAAFSSEAKGRTRSVLGNGLPVGTPTGAFPAPGSLSGFSETQRAIARHLVSGALPERARPGRARCVPDRIIGVAVNGVALLAPVDDKGRDLVAREVADACGGVVTEERLYGYRAASPCLPRGAGHGVPIGYAVDGFPVFGPAKKPKGLDACGGHRHRIALGDGRSAKRYHHHASARFPYLLGCLRGKPSRLSATAAPDAARAVLTAPGLFPAFDPGVEDYVVRCDGSPVRVIASSAPGETVSIDGAEPQSGVVARDVALAPGQAFTLAFADSAAKREHNVRCLPPDFPPFAYERTGRPTPAFQIVTPTTFGGSNYAAIFDRNGVPVWWYEPQHFPLDAALMSDGNLSWGRYFGGGYTSDPRGAYEIRRLDGSLVREVKTAGSPIDAHDLIEAPNGNLIALTYKPRATLTDLTAYGGPAAATVVDAEIQELNPAGAVVWSWNSKDHIALSETGRWWPTTIANPTVLPDGRTAYDPVHINSVAVSGDSLIISTRNTDSIYSISRATGAIRWKLGGTARPESLAVVGDPRGGFPLGAQHDARVLADGTVTIHDNRSDLGQPPRGVRYAVDEGAGTATFVEAVSDPTIPASACCGSARRMPGGSWVFSWGGTPTVTELRPDGSRVFRLRFLVPPTFSYRSFPVLDGGLDPAALRRGMSTMHPRPQP